MSFLVQIWFERIFFAASAVVFLSIAIAAYRIVNGTPLSPLKQWLVPFIISATMVLLSRLLSLAMLVLPSSASMNLRFQNTMLFDVHMGVALYGLIILVTVLPRVIRDTNKLITDLGNQNAQL